MIFVRKEAAHQGRVHRLFIVLPKRINVRLFAEANIYRRKHCAAEYIHKESVVAVKFVHICQYASVARFAARMVRSASSVVIMGSTALKPGANASI